MYALCKLVYADPKSWRHRTVDGSILSTSKKYPGMVLYSVVYEHGVFSRTDVFPCFRQGETFRGLKAILEAGAARLDEDVRILCIERLGYQKLLDAVSPDFVDDPDSLSILIGVLEDCFGAPARPRSQMGEIDLRQ